MQERGNTTTRAAMVLALAGTLGTGACAHVGQDDFDAGMAELRAEMRQGDDEVARRANQRMDGLEARLADLEQDLRTLEEEVGVTVERMETALRFHVPVYFGFDRADLDADARVVLDRFGEVAGDHYPEALITVEGFTDPSGSAAYNQRLGLRRAEAVRRHLIERAGLFEGQVRAVSYGEDDRRLVLPGASGPGTAGWQNRRVTMVIDHQGAGPAPLVSPDAPTS